MNLERQQTFEYSIYQLLKKTKKTVFNNNRIKKQFGENIKINHMLSTDTVLICFYDRWINSPLAISTTDFSYFIACVDEVARQNNMYAVGIHVSNRSLSFEDGQLLNIANQKHENQLSNTSFYSIYDMDEHTLLNKIYYFLHTNGVHMYDEDGDCIMNNLS
jgi:hypothetical protein